MSWNIDFYQKENGEIPAYDFLQSLPAKLQAKAFSEIELLEQCGTMLKEPYVKPIVGKKYQGLWEIRIRFASENARIFYFMFFGNTFVLLHGFKKKTMRTPLRELERALQYKADYERRSRK